METNVIRLHENKTPEIGELPQPDPSLKRLDVLVGTWTIEGRVSGSYGEVSGEATFEWIAGGFYLAQRFHMNFIGQSIEGIEIIGHDPSSQCFTATLYSNMGMSPPYKWDVQDDIVIHSTAGSKYTGRFSEDRNTLTGRWEPEEGKAGNSSVAYDAIMTRTNYNEE